MGTGLLARPVNIPGDLATIEEVIEEHSVKLLVVDVLMAYLDPKVNAYRDQDVRRALHSLKNVAERTGCCVVCLRHLNKMSGSSALNRGGGSIGISGAARAVYLVGPDPEDDGTNVLARVKNNLAAPDSLRYRLQVTSEVVHIEWDGASDRRASDLVMPDDDDEGSDTDAVADWLMGYLTKNGGQVPASDIFTAAAKEKYRKRTVQRARERTSIRSERRGFGQGAVWVLDP
jgi:hypothetical protein